MESTSNSTLDIPTTKVFNSAVSQATTSSSTNVVFSEGALTKRIIRKITPLDPKKLQQTGLDRKIAEALSKQKSQQNSNPANRSSHVLTSSKNEINSTVSEPISAKTDKELSPAKNIVIAKKTISPKIIITGSESLTELKTQNLAGLDSHQRLVHVKNLLNKKLQQKQIIDVDSKKIRTQRRLPTKASKDMVVVGGDPSHHFSVITESVDGAMRPMDGKLTKAITLQKSPQDIARKLNFQTDARSNATQAGDRDEIPKASIKTGKIQQQCKNTPSNAKQNSLPLMQSHSFVNVVQKAQNFQGEYLKQQQITYPNNSYKQVVQGEQKLDYPEVSPLKAPFPTVNVPKETPLPTIDSFKKPYPMVTSAYYDLQHKLVSQTDLMTTNYDTTIFNNPQPTTPFVPTNVGVHSSVANSLIVLENKVLSQDEMIDLTELRFSTSKYDTPRFANPHIPIPEVVIKQENIDECQYIAAKTSEHAVTNAQNHEISTGKVAIAKKQSKRIIINAQKLKLPPEQLAELAKKIKQTTSAPILATKPQDKSHKVEDMIILNTKVTSMKKERLSLSPKEITDKFIIQNNQIYTDDMDNDNYRSKQFQQDLKVIDGKHFIATKQSNVKTMMNQIQNDKNQQSHIDKSTEEIIIMSKDDCDISQRNSQEVSQNTPISFECFSDNSKSVVEIIDEPLETEDCFTAVDFIAALSNTNPITEELSLELSLEEINLNASCAMNLSPLRIQSCPTGKYTETLQKSSTSKQQQQMSTIVIESSQGAETILSNEKDNKLQTFQSDHNKFLNEMEAKKFSQAVVTTDSCSKVSNALSTDSLATESHNVTIHKMCNSKMPNNMLSCDIFIEKSSERNDLKSESKSLTECLSTPSVHSTSNVVINDSVCQNSLKSSRESCHFKPQLILEPCEETNSLNLTSVSAANDTKQMSPTTSNVQMCENISEVFTSITATKNSISENLLRTITITTGAQQERVATTPLKSPEERLISKSTHNNLAEHLDLDLESNRLINILPIMSLSCEQTDTDKSGAIQVLPSIASTQQLLANGSENNYVEASSSPTTFVDEMSAKTNGIIKFPEEPETSKASKVKTAPATITKRISRFKKGKINLVQRHKGGKESNQSLSAVKNNQNLNTFNEKPQSDKMNNDTTTKKRKNDESPLNKESNQFPSKNENQNLLITNQTNKNVRNIAGVRETADLVTRQISAAEEIHNTESSVQPQVSLDKIIAAQNSQNIIENDMLLEESNMNILPQKLVTPQFVTPTRASKNTILKDQTTSNADMPKADDFPTESEQEKAKHNIDFMDSQQNVSLTEILSPTSANVGCANTLDMPVKMDSSSQSYSKSPKESFSKSLNSDTIDIPKASVKIGHGMQHHSNSPTKNSQQHIKLGKQKIHSPEIPQKIVKAENVQEMVTKEATHKSQEQIEIPESNPKIVIENEDSDALKNISKTKCLNLEPEAVLKTMKNANISLVDVVKHSPIKPTVSNETTVPIEDVIELEVSNKEDQNEQQRSEKEIESVIDNINSPKKEISKSIAKENEIKVRETSPSTSSTTKRHCTSPPISDDELEFLPENTETKTKTSKSNTESNAKILSPPKTHSRRHRLYSKPQESDLSSHTSPPNKRTRYYSQTSETNVSISFDDTSQQKEDLEIKEPNNVITTATEQHKQLDETTVDIETSYNDTDSEHGNHDYDCEESNEFLGFEEASDSNSFKTVSHNVKTHDHETNSKSVTLKNWLTTGKAISPTFDKMLGTKRKRFESELPASSTSCETKGLVPLKKRWDLCSNLNKATEFTENTCSADCEEGEIDERSSFTKRCMRANRTVFDTNKASVDSNEIKLNDSSAHSFVERYNHNCTKPTTFVTDSDYPEGKATAVRSPNSQLTVKNSKESSAAVSKSFETNDLKRNNSDSQDYRESKHLKAKNNENKSKNRCKSKEKYSRKSKSKVKDDKADNLDIPQQQEITNKTENVSDRTEKFGEKETDIKFNTQQNTDQVKNNRKAITINASKEIEENNKNTDVNANATNTRKRGRSKGKLKHITDSPAVQICKTNNPKEICGDTECNKIITDSSEDKVHSASSKKHSSKIKSKRKPKTEDVCSDFVSTVINKAQVNENAMDNLKPTATPKLGRRPKSNTESNFNPRLLLITNREQLDTDEVLADTKSGCGSIQCGLCLHRTEPAKWKLHLAEHYGVGWQVGEERLHIENRSVVLSNILNYLKETGSKGLSCRMCKKVYRSALGVLMHIEGCGAQTVRVICEYCKKDYAKTTLPIHMRSCYARIALENQSSDENPDESNENKKEEIFGNSGRLKRNSTIKAENKLKVLGEELEKVPDNASAEKSVVDPKSRIRYVPPLAGDFGSKWSKDIAKHGKASCPKARCKFTSKDLKELSVHTEKCKYIKSGYFCNFCRQRVFKSEKEAIEHVIKNHQNGRRREKSDDSDCDMKIGDEQSSDESDLSEGVNESEIEDHNVTDEDDVCDNIDSCNRKDNKKPKTKKPYSRVLNQSTNPKSRKEVFDGRFKNLNMEVLKKWKSFLKSNYSCEILYADFTTQHSVITQSDFYKYLPTQTVSMKFNFKTQPSLNATLGVPENIEWLELKRYESVNNQMNTYMFLGAPIKFCSWLPVPAHVNEQYLVVVYRQEMFKFIKFSQPKQHHTIILIFKVTENDTVPELNIHYGFMIRDGPVHHITFLPSGGYDESSNRLGLAAVATVTSCIKVYSLPLNVEPSSTYPGCSGDQNITLIDVKPSFFLNLQILNLKEVQKHTLLNPQCLQICWSEYSGHQHIFASFSNGFMGIWDIANDPQQNLNRFVVDGVVNYVPLNYFYVGEKRVKCFAVHYDTCGPRWLAASGAYRKFVIYDIKNFMQPVIMKDDVNKNILQSMDWCPLWETLLYSYCDTIPNNGRCVLVINPTNIMFSHHKLDFMACGVTQVHYTPVTNMCVASLNNGDIVFLNTKELHYDCALSKKFGDRRMLYSMDIKQLNGQPLMSWAGENLTNDNLTNDNRINDNPINDNLLYENLANDNIINDNLTNDNATKLLAIGYDYNYKEKYGLIFEPLIKLKESDKKTYLNEKRCPPVNMIPFMRINTLRCNFNANGKNLIAAGYENGFLRLIYFNKSTVFCN